MGGYELRHRWYGSGRVGDGIEATRRNEQVMRWVVLWFDDIDHNDGYYAWWRIWVVWWFDDIHTNEYDLDEGDDVDDKEYEWYDDLMISTPMSMTKMKVMM